MVGMNAVIMDGAEIGENSIVGAMAFVKAAAVIEANKLVVGSPARVLRDLTEQELAWKVAGTREYHDLVLRCKSSLHEVAPLSEIEPGRQRLSFGDHLIPKSQL
jgi:phenylacetic acid degradation protein